ncbi:MULTISPECIES: zeta toxin family protein [unclassified Ensifer]|uniref:zeta toxin family protein n=1 Tax=unclassified Ensifer TaxID=2633371 RepID=UPI0008138AB8|nr:MULTISPECIES: zeta toxin family protein [unclassified Ensifer]OCP22462.1 zeta toxin [Ensifer sp. LC54]OCP22672.1 zeta toxin [Ensifer sp. LC384]
MADEASGLLSLARNESIFRTDILRDYLPDNIGRAERPRLILLGGQPGAGKTAVLTASQNELARSGPTIRIVGDDLRPYHPQYLAFQRQDPETASRYTQMDAGRWTEKLLAAATERQVNVVFETTMRTPENVARVIRTARDAGYAVEVRAVAVNPRLSWQGAHHRFEEMLHAGLAARIPPQHVHDAAVDGLRVRLEKLEGEGLVDRIQLRTRTGAIIYDNELRDGQWSYAPRSRLALEREQTRPMTRGELQRFADDWNHVLARMEERRAPDNRVADLKTRAADDVRYLLAQRREADGTERQRRGRTILQSPADGHRQFVELYDNAVRDAERRPIGNVEAHAVGRLAQTYMALRLVEAARDLGLLPEDGKIVATRAIVRDKQGAREFPAAHRMPADLSVETADGSRRRLTEHFAVELNRVAIDRDVFSPTDRMSRLANVADSWTEAAGMRNTLVRAANGVASGSMSADQVMSKIVEPGYAAAIATARHRLERNMALAERAAIATAIVDVNGVQFRGVREDPRLRTADIENRARAKSMMEAALAETALHDRLEPEGRRAAGAFVQGIAENERKLALGMDHRLGRDRAPGLGTALVPARHLPDLTEPEIGERLQRPSRLADKRAQMANLWRLVFGNSKAVSASLQRISDGRSGVAAGADVREGRLGEMAGEGRRWLRGASPQRQAAGAHAPKLAAALADYGLAMEFERHQIVSQHREEQARQRVEVPRPSARLSDVLGAENTEPARRLNAEPGLRRELESLFLAISKRLSPGEKADLKGGNVARMASSLGISQEQGVSLRDIHERASALQDRALRQNRECSRGSQLDIRR